MRYFIGFLFIILLLGCQSQRNQTRLQAPVMVIHGGAGSITKERFNDSLQALYRAKLTEAVNAGYMVLNQGGKAVEAVEAAIRVMESSPLFNAGYGGVLTAEGKVELDASIMNGEDLNAGAVASVSRILHPISLAKLVMEKTPHVLLVSSGAEKFAITQNIPLLSPDSLISPRRKAQWNRQHSTSFHLLQEIEKFKKEKFGTVGAVALDQYGHLAAGTSTGGISNKMPGRVGDSPIIGAGTYADDQFCAISATGQGEFFIRLAIAHEISALMKHNGLSLKDAAHRVIFGELNRLQGRGGVIGLDRKGHVVFEFNTSGMFRAYKDQTGKTRVFFFGMNTDDVE